MQEKAQNTENKTIDLNEPFLLGDLQLKNRFVMAPLTRCRTDPKNCIPTDLVAEYYEQRANFGLIITECTQISTLSHSFPGSCGIHNQEQADGWKKVIDRVHAKGGKIILQIWHCGRAVAKEFINGQDPIAPSPIPISTINAFTQKNYPVPREMTKEDIKNVIEEFRVGAEFAKNAGFDGVQLHGANGFLIHQFLCDSTNQRTDEYGGSIENRSRFLFEVLDALISVFGSNRVSVRFSPTARYNDSYDSNPIELFTYVLQQLNSKKLHFVEIKRHNTLADKADPSETNPEQDTKGRTLPHVQVPTKEFFSIFRKAYDGFLIGNDGLTPEQAVIDIKNGDYDLASFGGLAIGNPDLPQRVKNGWEINTKNDYSTYFTPGPKGYTDYPEYSQQ